jgi:hypothetical protein
VIEQVDPSLLGRSTEEPRVPWAISADQLHTDAVSPSEPAVRTRHQHGMLLSAAVQARELDRGLVALRVFDGYDHAHVAVAARGLEKFESLERGQIAPLIRIRSPTASDEGEEEPDDRADDGRDEEPEEHRKAVWADRPRQQQEHKQHEERERLPLEQRLRTGSWHASQASRCATSSSTDSWPA